MNTYIKTIIVSILVAVGLPINTMAMPNPSCQAFEVYVPDTVVQGQPFQVVYYIEATEWGEKPIPDFGNIELMEADWHVDAPDADNYSTLELDCVLRTSTVGKLRIPALTMTIGGQEMTTVEKEICVTKNEKYGKQIEEAEQFLLGKGVKKENINLSLRGRIGHLNFFSDPKSGVFVVIVNDEFKSVVENPVMAYGLEHSYMGTRLNLALSERKLFTVYNRQLEELMKMEATWESIIPNHRTVKPLLGSIEWSQTAPYNDAFPVSDKTGEKMVVGCGPVAIGQIMKYHNWPEKGNEEVTIDWQNGVSNLLYEIGVDMGADFGTTMTQSYLQKAKFVLQRYFDYSPQMFHCDNISDIDIITLIHRELDEQRPCLVSDNGHTFICDGREGEYLHFNLGWGGNFNAYYRCAVLPGVSVRQTPLYAGIFGITPLKEKVKKEIMVTTPGTLDQLLSDNEVSNVNELKVIGTLGSKDIRTLRLMAGAGEENNPFAKHGSLYSLDLSQAKFVNDAEPYYTKEAVGIHLFLREKESYNKKTIKNDLHEYVLDSELSEDVWQKMKERKVNVYPDCYFDRVDGKFYCNYELIETSIGQYMFCNCANLMSVQLPQNIKKIGRSAFSNCYCLQDVELPASVQSVDNYSFAHTLSLDAVYSHSQFTTIGTNETIFEETSPTCRGFIQQGE